MRPAATWSRRNSDPSFTVGWRATNADYPQDLYLAHGAELVGEPEVDETAEVRWMLVGETPAMIARGEILGAITITGCGSLHSP